MSITSMIAKAATTLTHKRPDRSARGRTGASTVTLTTLASAVACWVQPATARVVARYAQRQTEVSHCAFVAQDLDAKADDVLAVSDGRTLKVIGQADQAGLGKVWRVDCVETA